MGGKHKRGFERNAVFKKKVVFEMGEEQIGLRVTGNNETMKISGKQQSRRPLRRKK